MRISKNYRELQKITMINKNKSGQEEMVGFAIIIILVAVIFLVFLGLALNSSKEEIVQSYEVESFIQALLQFTTDCEDNFEYRSVQGLILDCSDGEICLDERDACDVLNSTLKNIIEETWKVGQERPVQGYELIINLEGEEILSLKKGNSTKESKGAKQELGIRDGEIFLTAYS